MEGVENIASVNYITLEVDTAKFKTIQF